MKTLILKIFHFWSKLEHLPQKNSSTLSLIDHPCSSLFMYHLIQCLYPMTVPFVMSGGGTFYQFSKLTDFSL
jgi:hypothetical protein